jgi:uncharacterized repeat protein (TIGR01451 family)
MTRFFKLCLGVVLLALVFNIGIACAEDNQGLQADLNVTKVVRSTGPYNLQDNVLWIVTLYNNGPDNATNITVGEDLSGLTGLLNISASPSLGEYNATTNIWNITELKNATSATLTLTTNFSTAGKKINRVVITALNETDPHPDDHSANATVQYNTTESIPPAAPVSSMLVIKPTTLNLKSEGVFSVYVIIAGIAEKSPADQRNKPRIDYNNSSLTCDGAEMIRASVSNKDGGTLIAKFHRYDLENVTSGNGVTINCSGTLVVNGKPINVEGSDTIRVIGERTGLDKIFSGLWKFLGVEKDDVTIIEGEEGNITVTLSLNPDNFRNPGLVKKILKYEDNESAKRSPNETGLSVEYQKEHTLKNNGNSKQIRESNSNNKPDKGKNNKNDDESDGKANGKKD